MPNINLVNTIGYPSYQTYFIVSDNRLVRRINYNSVVSNIMNLLPVRTDQALFTTSSVTFNSLDLVDTAGTSTSTNVAHALNFDYVHSDLGKIRFGDIIGSIRFGGDDGLAKIAREKGLGAVNFFGYALEDFGNDGTNSLTTNAGAGWSIVQQPIGVQLSLDSRRRVLNSRSVLTGNPALPPLNVLQLGSIEASPVPVITTSSNGAYTFSGPGRTLLTFVNSTVDQFGIPAGNGSTADNPTLLGTNVYAFQSSRTSTFFGRKDALLNNDSIGVIEFRGFTQNNTTATAGAVSAVIFAHASENFTPTAHGASIHLRTTPLGTALTPSNRLDLQSDRNLHTSGSHLFVDNSGRVAATLTTSSVTLLNNFTVTSSAFVFPDATQQQTAYNISQTVPTSSTSTGIAGQLAYDANYLYVCTSTDFWYRIPLQTF